MSERAWCVGLTCRRCGRRVKTATASGGLLRPVGARGRKLVQTWAEHGACPVVAQRGGGAPETGRRASSLVPPSGKREKAAAVNIPAASPEERMDGAL